MAAEARKAVTGAYRLAKKLIPETKNVLRTFASQSPAESPKIEPNLRALRSSDDLNDGDQGLKAASVF
jgi:hypothetical protein